MADKLKKISTPLPKKKSSISVKRPASKKSPVILDLKQTAQQVGSLPTKRNTFKIKQRGVFYCSVILLLLFIVTIFAYLGYLTNKPTIFCLKNLHLPAMSVNGQTVLLSDFLSDTAALQKYYQRTGEDYKLAAIRNQLAGDLLKKYVIFDLASKAGIVVTDQELAKELSTNTKINDLTDELYGWTPKVYGQKIVKPLLLTEKLATNFYQSSALIPYTEKIQNISKRLNVDPELFETIAAEVNEDQSKYVAGDLGWFDLSALGQNLAPTILSLQPGEISAVVEADSSLRIFKLYEKITSDNRVVFHLGQIFITRPSFADYLSAQIKNAKVWSLVNI